MKAVYLDNYRGFKAELIPLHSVNFLVGENSTGKTSFLAALKVLGSARFWIRPSFNDPDLHFSSFSEIMSKKSTDKKYFTVGYYDSTKVSNEKGATVFRLITFKNEEGLPVVHKYSFLSPIGLISTVISNGSLLYKVIESSDISAKNLIEICTSEHLESRSKDYKKISKKGFPRQLFFANAYQFIVADLEGKDLLKGKKTFTFEIEIDAPECRWIAPIRANPERIYLNEASEYSSEGSHIPNILNKLLGKTGKSKEPRMSAIIKEFGKSSGLFESVSIKRFGKEASSPFQINVNLGGNELLVSNVGYGVSQVLPIILEARRNSSEEFIAIQQPEVHLHPKAQAALGEFIYNASDKSNNKFLIETHSDYLIDRFRLCTSKGECKDAQVLFFERTSLGNKVHSIAIDSDGRYPLEQPEQFRDFFLSEQLELMRL
ncbi:AAA family ATPase [Undibacterium sp. TS12]|uniref:AAA family ATPase n=1 Tax=Undibacterium sp. TS12 TaxID=2908202 RepID=UPI001F4C74F5|nr:AAA family ATPase [Undibacterium sp. TS12]MCH8621445.1 ATP-binding protein [Undibacterium sp. TS12]